MYSYTIPTLPTPGSISADGSDYFVFRGNSKFRPETNVHYIPSLLRRFLTAGVVENINTILTVTFPGMTLVEYGAGIGQLTIRIGQSSSPVIAIEERKEYYSYLVRNIISYNLEKSVTASRTPIAVQEDYVLITYDTAPVPQIYANAVARVVIVPSTLDMTGANINLRDPEQSYINTIKISDTAMYIITSKRLSPERPPPDASLDTENLKEYREYAKSQLNGIVDESHYDAMFGPDSYQTWRDSITHKSVDPSHNYEMLEYDGDLILKSCFTTLLAEHFPNLTEQEATNLSSQYMSKRGQGPMTKQLSLDKFLVTDTRDNKQYEDVFESFFGAIFRLGERIRDGVGYGYAKGFMRNLIRAIFSKIDRRMGKGDPKTILEQRISQLIRHGKRILQITKGEVGPTKVVVITIPESYSLQLPLLAEAGYKQLPNPLGRGEHNKRKEAEQLAYVSAIRNLDEAGLTEEFAASRYVSNIFDFPELDSRKDELNAKLAARGIKSYDSANILTENADIHRVHLVGVLESGEKVILGEGISGSQDKALLQAVIAFLRS